MLIEKIRIGWFDMIANQNVNQFQQENKDMTKL